MKGQENTIVPVAKDFNTEKNASPSLVCTEASSVTLASERTCFLIPEVILHSKQSARELAAQPSNLI